MAPRTPFCFSFKFQEWIILNVKLVYEEMESNSLKHKVKHFCSLKFWGFYSVLLKKKKRSDMCLFQINIELYKSFSDGWNLTSHAKSLDLN